MLLFSVKQRRVFVKRRDQRETDVNIRKREIFFSTFTYILKSTKFCDAKAFSTFSTQMQRTISKEF